MRSHLFLLLTAACGGSPPAGTSPPPAIPPVTPDSAFDEGRALLAEGRIAEGLARLDGSADPRAIALRTVSGSDPAAALAIDAGDVDVARYRGRAAFRLGDAAAIAASVEALERAGAPAAEIAELRAMAAIAARARPPGLRHVVEDGPGRATFEPRMGVPVIEVQLGTEVVRFIFDTGAEVTVLDTAVAERLGIEQPEGARVAVEGNAGALVTAMGIVPRLTVLGRTIEEVPVVVAGLSLPPQLAIGGILGVEDLFATGVIRIDYREGTIARDAPSRSEGTAFAFIEGRAVLGVEGRIEGGPVGLFLVDTGGRRSTLVDAYVDRAVTAGASWTVSTPETVQVQAVGTAERQRRFLAEARFCFGDGAGCIDLADVPVDTTAADASTTQVGKLGADAFAGRVLELDFTSGRLRLQ